MPTPLDVFLTALASTTGTREESDARAPEDLFWYSVGFSAQPLLPKQTAIRPSGGMRAEIVGTLPHPSGDRLYAVVYPGLGWRRSVEAWELAVRRNYPEATFRRVTEREDRLEAVSRLATRYDPGIFESLEQGIRLPIVVEGYRMSIDARLSVSTARELHRALEKSGVGEVQVFPRSRRPALPDPLGLTDASVMAFAHIYGLYDDPPRIARESLARELGMPEVVLTSRLDRIEEHFVDLASLLSQGPL